MKDPFIEREWRDCCERLRRCAKHIARGDEELEDEFLVDADRFAQQSPPESYPLFLDRVRDSAKLAVRWQRVRSDRSEASETQQQRDSEDDQKQERLLGIDPTQRPAATA